VNGLAGAVVWAVVPFAPAAPFRLYAGVDKPPVEIEAPVQLIDAAKRGGDSQLTYLVPGKVRPVLIVSDAQDSTFGELLALRLARFTNLVAHEHEQIRNQESPTHFHLKPSAFNLPEENAAMIAGLVRIHASALDRTVLGRLNAQELAVVHQRLARHHQLDLRTLVRDELTRLAALQRGVK